MRNVEPVLTITMEIFAGDNGGFVAKAEGSGGAGPTPRDAAHDLIKNYFNCCEGVKVSRPKTAFGPVEHDRPLVTFAARQRPPIPVAPEGYFKPANGEEDI